MLPPRIGEQQCQGQPLFISISCCLPHTPLCAGVLPRPPPTTAMPLLTGTPPCGGGIRLLCRRFILVRLHHVRHARRVRCTSVSCVMKTFSCSGRGEPLLAVPCRRHARSNVLEHVLAALQRRVSWAGPLASGPGRSVHTYCASQGKEDASALWRWPHAGFGLVAKVVRKSLFYFQELLNPFQTYKIQSNSFFVQTS
jgi:hypothetical protein